METKRRNPIIAALLSIITAGLGQIYNGQLRKGLIYWIAVLVIEIISFKIGLFSFVGLLIALFVTLCFRLFIIGDAIVISMRRKEFTLKKYNRWYIYFLVFVLNISIAVPLEISINNFGAYVSPSISMEPTITKGDRFLIDRSYYLKNLPRRGDIALVEYPDAPGKYSIHRIIALEGDAIEIKNGSVFLNGTKLNEPYISKNYNINEIYGPLTVPKGKVFMMGDNRISSFDSRVRGLVGTQGLKGKYLYVYMSGKV